MKSDLESKMEWTEMRMIRWMLCTWCFPERRTIQHRKKRVGIRGFAKKKFQKSEIIMEVGGWVQVSLGIFFFLKSSQNNPKPVLIFWTKCILYVYTLLKVVGYYDLSVLSMSVMGLQKKRVSSIQFFFGFLEFI